MLHPSIDKLMDLADSKYTLVIAASKRARQLQSGAPRVSNVHSNKNVTVALNEIGDKQIRFARIKDSKN